MRLLFLFICTLLFGECNAANGYYIHGKVSNIQDGTLLYLRLVGPPSQDIDSIVVKNGEFFLKGETGDSPTWVTLSFKNKFLPLCDFYLEKGDIFVTGETYDSKAKGTRTNDEYNVYKQNILSLYNKQSGLYGDLAIHSSEKGTVYTDSMNIEIKKLESHIDSVEINYIKTYPASIVSLRILTYKSGRMDGNSLKSAISLLDSSLQNAPETLKMKQYAEDLLLSREGIMAADFSLVTAKGKSFKLSDLRGKYVLIDFWASWCAPCRNALPGLARLYDKYKGQDFEIVGFSIDQNLDKWHQALQEENCMWPQVCDPTGKVAKLYAVSLIPLTVIIDPNGKILSRGLSKNELADKLAEIFKDK